MSEPLAQPTYCHECGMPLRLGFSEYHPFTFCEWYRQGLEPWKLLSQRPYTVAESQWGKA